MENNKKCSELIFVISLYAISSLIITFPLVLNPTGQIIGHYSTDVINHVWNYWLVGKSFPDKCLFPYYISTDLVRFPEGGYLHTTDPLNSLLSIPLQALGGLGFAYNFLIFINLTLSAFGMYLLARKIIRNSSAAFISGISYGYSPYLLGELNNGGSEFLSAGFLPLFCLVFMEAIEFRRKNKFLLAVFIFLLTILYSVYNGICAFIFSFLYVIRILLNQRKFPDITKTIRNYIFFLALTSILFFPFGFLLWKSMSGPGALVYGDFSHKDKSRESSLSKKNFYPPPFLYLDPFRAFLPIQNPKLPDEIMNFSLPSYIGIFTLILAYFGGTIRHRLKSLWILVGIFSFILALGPYLSIFDQFVTLGINKIPLPFLAFYKLVPSISMVFYPRRFILLFTLAISILSGFGVKLLEHKFRRLPVKVITAICALSILSDFVICSQVKFPIPRTSLKFPAFYRELFLEPEDFSIIEAPLLAGNISFLYFLYQTQHGKKTQFCLPEWGGGTKVSQTLNNLELFHILASMEKIKFRSDPLSSSSIENFNSDISALAKMGFKYIVLHENFYNDKDRLAIQLMDFLVGEFRKYPDDFDLIRVYRIK